MLIVGCITQGFVAKLESNANGALNLMIWQCTSLGKVGVYLYLILTFFVLSQYVFNKELLRSLSSQLISQLKKKESPLSFDC